MPFLEYLFDPRRPTQRVNVAPLPFVIGRASDVNFTVSSPIVSGRHAEIVARDGDLWLRDLKSRNGTHVNGKPVHESRLTDGDIIHVAHTEFRFVVDKPVDPKPEYAITPGTDRIRSKVPPSVLYGKPLLEEMIQTDAVRCVYQPIVELSRGRTVAYEALGRGCFPQLSTRPADLFHLADMCRLSVELSQAFRRAAARSVVRELPAGVTLFCNLHPIEVDQLSPENFPEFAEGLPKLRGDSKLILEVHEDAIADVAMLRWLKAALAARGIGIAYDDFGAGQSRLTELAEVPPDFVKLDMRLVRGIDTSTGRADTVRALCELASKLGFAVIAEGIETLGELQVCKSLGCRIGQGFFLGHPEFSGPKLIATETVSTPQMRV